MMRRIEERIWNFGARSDELNGFVTALDERQEEELWEDIVKDEIEALVKALILRMEHGTLFWDVETYEPVTWYNESEQAGWRQEVTYQAKLENRRVLFGITEWLDKAGRTGGMRFEMSLNTPEGKEIYNLLDYTDNRRELKGFQILADLILENKKCLIGRKIKSDRIDAFHKRVKRILK